MTNPFIRLLKMETSKAIKNKFFLTTLIIASILALLSAWYMIDSYFYFRDMEKILGTDYGNPQPYGSSLYTHWLGGEFESLSSIVFFTLMPLLAILPYGWSYVNEARAGYVKTVVIRSNKWSYHLAKYMATFISGGLIILVPLVLNFLIVASFIPAITPSTLNPFPYGVEIGSMWSGLFYTYPFIYVFLFLILDFIFAGLFATMSLAISFFIKNRITVMLAPFLLLLILHYSREFLAYKYYNQTSPLFYLHAIGIENPSNMWIILTQGLLFFTLTFGVTMLVGGKREIL
ncbi:hypothetical protein SAMN05421736_13321 [Evansella caseinilytica]|uniref:ABC-2 family transporter n=1 Tax=Evansella caseinilytica TaxID=1503961 RepID=A0A1H3V0N8_9BACI|nr:hypothetical protein [Evansella caseinilytica]SDZ68273.1 hypothetical protein SAMN05421736_13321 [Evansella caseinilytica]